MDTIDSALFKIGTGKFHILLLAATTFILTCSLVVISIFIFLGPLLSCSWRISHIEESLITMSVLIGMMIGTSLFGTISDKYGRKWTLVTSNLGLFYFGMISALSPTVGWMMIMRFFIGIFGGGILTVTYVLLAELTPSKNRGTFLILSQSSRSIGNIFLATVCLVSVPRFGWRICLSALPIPIIGALLCLIWIPESPRFLALHNQKKEGLEVINYIAKMNRSHPITDVCETQDPKSSFRDLIHSNYLSTTIYLSCLSLVLGFLKKASMIIVPIIHDIPHRCLENMKTFSTLQIKKTTDDSCCFHLTWVSYENLYIATCGEALAIPISIVLLRFISRKKFLSLIYAIIALVVLFLNFCLSPLLLKFLLFIFISSVNLVLIISILYATEVYPTSVRSIGSGISNSFANIGGLLAPVVVNVIIVIYSFIGGTMCMFSFSVIAAIISLLLPHETKDRELYETANHGNAINEGNKNYDTFKNK